MVNCYRRMRPVSNMNLGILGRRGASVLQVVRVKGHVLRRAVVGDPALYPPVYDETLTK